MVSVWMMRFPSRDPVNSSRKCVDSKSFCFLSSLSDFVFK